MCQTLAPIFYTMYYLLTTYMPYKKLSPVSHVLFFFPQIMTLSQLRNRTNLTLYFRTSKDFHVFISFKLVVTSLKLYDFPNKQPI